MGKHQHMYCKRSQQGFVSISSFFPFYPEQEPNCIHTCIRFSISQGNNPQKLFFIYNLQDAEAAILTSIFITSWIQDVSNSTIRESNPPYLPFCSSYFHLTKFTLISEQKI